MGFVLIWTSCNIFLFIGNNKWNRIIYPNKYKENNSNIYVYMSSEGEPGDSLNRVSGGIKLARGGVFSQAQKRKAVHIRTIVIRESSLPLNP